MPLETRQALSDALRQVTLVLPSTVDLSDVAENVAAAPNQIGHRSSN
jgi:hypothetical protein